MWSLILLSLLFCSRLHRYILMTEPIVLLYTLVNLCGCFRLYYNVFVIIHIFLIISLLVDAADDDDENGVV